MKIIKPKKSTEKDKNESRSSKILLSVDYPKGFRINNNTSNVVKTFHN